METIQTPRTDQMVMVRKDDIGVGYETVPAHFSRSIERELSLANGKLSTILRAVDKAEALNNASTDNEVAASASFNEAIANIALEHAEAERDQWKACAQELAKAVYELHALVKGECPSLLNEDSGGCSRTDLLIIGVIADFEKLNTP